MSTRPPLGCSVPSMVERYLGTEYDKVKLVADNIEYIIKMGLVIEKEIGKITFSATVPNPTTTLNPWFVNTTTSKMYYKVAGENATYWVELNSHGEL